MALADPGRAVHENRLVARDELAGGEVEDLGLVELGIEAEVKALEGLAGVERGAPEPQPELALGPALDLVLQQRRECKFPANLRHLFSSGMRHLLGHGLREGPSHSRGERECFQPWREARSSS
jgi:hypothetical protein